MSYRSLRWPDGASYSGEFRTEHGAKFGLESDMHGTGNFRWPNGQTYRGEFRFGNRNGHGTYTWPNFCGGVSTLTGNFENGFPKGRCSAQWVSHQGTETNSGSYTFQGGSWYLTGTGTTKFDNFGQYEGLFDDSLPTEGVWTDINGDKYDVVFNTQYLKNVCKKIPGVGYEFTMDVAMKKFGDAVFQTKSLQREAREKLRREAQRCEQEAQQRQEQLRREKNEEKQRLRERQLIVQRLQQALTGGEPCEIPFELLAQWTDNFSALKQIGEGAFGEVFQAEVEGLPRLAVKRLSQNIRLHGDAEEKAAAHLCVRREINLLSSFRHPNIIKLVGFTNAQDRDAVLAGTVELCLAYELASRRGLHDNLRDDDKACDLTPVCRIRIAADISRALNYLHCRDPVSPAYHRDLKSANIALTGDRRAKLIDCGLAKYTPQSQRNRSIMTGSQVRLGTPGYMCRKFIDTGVYEAKSEIYSFGIVLLELLTGRLQTDAQQFDLYETYVEEEEDIQGGLDVRAGSWDPTCVAALLTLARGCTARYSRRLSPMVTVVRSLVELEAHHCAPTIEEEVLARHNAELLSEVEALRLPGGVSTARSLCCVCLDTVPCDGGAECPAGEPTHWVCRPCFAREVAAQLSAEMRGAFAAHGTRVVCRQCLPTTSTYPDGALARALDDDDFAAFREAAVEVAVSRVCQEQEERLQQQLAALRAELSRNDGDERVRRHRLRVAENILCLRCPRRSCGQAFVDFVGCFALSCSRCGCGFCAYCLSDCGSDAHRHVAACVFNTAPGREVYGRAELFDQAQKQRRGRMLAEYMAEQVAAGDQEAVKAAIRGDVQRLGMTVT